jgi:hypothetical protein
VIRTFRLNRIRTILLPVAMAGAAWLASSQPATAQSARATGVVRDVATGRPLKGATVRAVNPEAYPSELTSATDDKGRWAMIGLRTGTWKFIVEAPGYLRIESSAPVRVAATQPLVITLARDPGPVPNALDKSIQQLLKDAAALRDQGRLDQAISSYVDIRTKNPKLTHVNLVLADVHRRKAATEQDAAARRAQLDLAVEAYGEVLKHDAANALARAGIDAVRGDTALGNTGPRNP